VDGTVATAPFDEFSDTTSELSEEYGTCTYRSPVETWPGPSPVTLVLPLSVSVAVSTDTTVVSDL
jgi:hypothetical protein